MFLSLNLSLNKKAVSVLKKATQIIIVCQNSLPFCITSKMPCVELYQSSARDGSPSAFACTRTRCSNCRLNLNPFTLRLRTAPDGSTRGSALCVWYSLCLLDWKFSNLVTGSHWSCTADLPCPCSFSSPSKTDIHWRPGLWGVRCLFFRCYF